MKLGEKVRTFLRLEKWYRNKALQIAAQESDDVTITEGIRIALKKFRLKK